MANFNNKHEKNIEGEFYVDSSCINCDTCRQLASTIFSDTGIYSAVIKQPTTDEETFNALQAVVACPTSSIGTLSN